MKAIIHERYIIPISSINFIQRVNSKDIRITFNALLTVMPAYFCVMTVIANVCAHMNI